MISSPRILSCLVSALLLALGGCCPNCGPRIDSVNPSEIVRGPGPSPSPVQITFEGAHLINCTTLEFDDGFEEGLSGVIQSVADEQVIVQLVARENAFLGSHQVGLYCGNDGGSEVEVTFTCPGATPCDPPILSAIPDVFAFTPGEQNHVLRFVGRYFRNTSPIVEADSAD